MKFESQSEKADFHSVFAKAYRHLNNMSRCKHDPNSFYEAVLEFERSNTNNLLQKAMIRTLDEEVLE